MRFGAPLAINDLLSALRTHFSALLIGASLGIELLGLFYFAYNAGLGLSMSLIRSLNQVLFSHFCRSRQPRNSRNLTRPEYSYTTGELRLGIGVGMGTMIAAVMSQTLLAPYYVPLLFGERWVDAGALPLLIILCLSALPLPLASVASQLLCSYGRPGDDLWAQLLYTSLTMAALIIGIRGGLQGAALAILLSNLLFCPLFLHQVLRNSHKRKKFIAVKT
jgi:PST family polysaccharide transporter